MELVHIILKGIKKFSNIRLEDFDEDDDDFSGSNIEANIKKERESYEVMRICRLNRIKIKNPQKWDKA